MIEQDNVEKGTGLQKSVGSSQSGSGLVLTNLCIGAQLIHEVGGDCFSCLRRRLDDVESVSQGHKASTGQNGGLNVNMPHPDICVPSTTSVLLL